MTKEETYRAQEVIRITGLSNRQLQYWDESDFIKPSFKTPRRRLYTIRDVILLKVSKTLQNTLGYSLQELRPRLARLRELLPIDALPLEECLVYTDGENFIVAEKGRYLNFSFKQNMLKFDLGEIVEWARYVKKNKGGIGGDQLVLSF